MKSRKSNYYVKSVEKGFQILNSFNKTDTVLDLTELSNKTSLNKATVRRFALTLVDLGYLLITKERKFKIGPKVLELSEKYLGTLNFPDLALPILEKLSDKTNESTNLAILDNGEVLYVARVHKAERILNVNLQVGSRLPYYATSLGKSLVAWLPENERKEIWQQNKISKMTENTFDNYSDFEKHLENSRKKGFTVSKNELEFGLQSIAVPIFDSNNNVIASMNVSTNILRVTEKTLLDIYLPELQKAGKELNEEIKAKVTTGKIH